MKNKDQMLLEEAYSKVNSTKAEETVRKYIDSGFKGDLDLSEMNLKRLPKILKDITVNGSFFCCHNKLTTLENSPKVVTVSFWCFDNQLISLEAGPKIVKNQYDCQENLLLSLKGCPEGIHSLDCSNNPALISLEGCPTSLRGDFEVNDCDFLKSLKGAPSFIGRNFNCESTPILSLIDAPLIEVKGKFYHDEISEREFKEHMKLKRMKKDLPELEGIF